MEHAKQVAWVIIQYPPTSTTGKYALSLAEAGMGYKLLNKMRAKSDNIILAFLRPTDQPLRDNMVVATDEQKKKLNSLKD